MYNLKITNQNLKEMRESVQITSNVKELLVDDCGCELIKISDVKELFIECGGSPFLYLLRYNDGRWGNEGWEESDSPYNFYSYYENDYQIRRLDESELSIKMIEDCLKMMNYPSIGKSVFEKLTDTKFENNNLSETYIPFSLILNLFSIETDYDIVGCRKDLNEIKGLQLNCMEYFEEEIL